MAEQKVMEDEMMYLACDVNPFGFRSCGATCGHFKDSSYGEDCCMEKWNMRGYVALSPDCPLYNVALTEVEQDILDKTGFLNLWREIER